VTAAERRASLAHVRRIARDVRTLVTYDGHSSPPDWGPFIAELADEVAKILVMPRSRRNKKR